MDDPNAKRLEKLKAEVAKFESVAEFARQYGLDETYIRQLLSGHRSFGERSARNIGTKISGNPSHFAINYEIIAEPGHYERVATNSYSVRVFDALASAGLGQPQPFSDTVIGNIQLSKTWVDSHLPNITSPGNLNVLSAYGDSMAPTFSDGDLLLVDTGVKEIRLDAIYILSLNNELYVKRVQRRITDGSVTIKSDNPLYDPVTITNGERDSLSVLGRVVWTWNGRKL